VKKLLLRYAAAIAAVLAVTVGLSALTDHINSTTVALTLLLVVLSIATFYGRNPALVASFAAMLSFNYFFLPPVRTWHVADPQNLIAWAAFTMTAIIAGELSSYARRREREAAKLYTELQDAFKAATEAEAFRQSEKLKSALLDAVTHDLRTPLTSIKASVTTLLESEGGHRTIELDGEGRAEFLNIINEETDRLNRFIEGMVELARLEAGTERTTGASCRVDEVISLALERAQTLEHRKVNIELEPDLPPAAGDAHALAEVLFNLLENAAKYSPENTPVTVAGARDIDRIDLSIIDEGPGIPVEMRMKVFDKFVRLDDGKGGGLGLGLAIAHGIIEAQGGSITIGDGDGGRGTKVTVTLPIATHD
jgi:K+-sensing histidine kinase KdpD